MSYLNDEELKLIGFKKYGKNVKISNKSSIYGASSIQIGDNVRIDDFSILSAVGGFITIGSHIHIASHAILIGAGGIEMNDFSGLSSRVALYSASDDYSGDYLIGPVMEEDCLNIIKGQITLQKYVTIGTSATIMPNVNFGEGSVLGAYSMATRDTEEWSIYAGVPARKIKNRKKGLLNLTPIMIDKWK